MTVTVERGARAAGKGMAQKPPRRPRDSYALFLLPGALAFLAIIVSVALSLLVIGALVGARSRRSRAEQAAAIAEADSILAPLPTARGEGSGERGPGLVDRGGEQ